MPLQLLNCLNNCLFVVTFNTATQDFCVSLFCATGVGLDWKPWRSFSQQTHWSGKIPASGQSFAETPWGLRRGCAGKSNHIVHLYGNKWKSPAFAPKDCAEGALLWNVPFQEGTILFLLQVFITFLLYAPALRSKRQTSTVLEGVTLKYNRTALTLFSLLVFQKHAFKYWFTEEWKLSFQSSLVPWGSRI